jgi:cleavage stimulation factor subunit 3
MIIKSEPGAVSDVEGGDDMASDSMETEAPATERAADTAADKGPPVIDEPANELVKEEPKRDERGAIVGYIDPQPATESSAMDSQSTFAGAEIIPVEKSEPSTEAALDRTATGAAEGGDPYADTRMWVRILAEATSKPLVEARESFEAVVTMFPTAGQYWRSYIEKEIGSSDEDQVLGLFSRCLTACCNRELWRLYIRFMKQIKAGTPTARTDLMNAYALATEHHGMDINAAWLWHEYISFAKTLETDNPWERVKELTEARKLYRRALGTPMHDLDSLWRDYEKFENDWGKNTAETALMKARDCYQTSKKCLRERKILWDKVSQHMLARPPASVQKGVDDELTVSQLEAWRNLIDYEKGNAQCLEEEDLLKRVSFTYNCCLVCFHHYAEIWYEAALVCLDAKQSVMARAILKRGLEALPKSPLLTFAYADFEEEQNKLNDSVAAYESLLALTKDPLICAHLPALTSPRIWVP